MKKLLTIGLILTALVGLTFAQGITNSAHDFSGDNWNPAGEKCNTCHTPHNAQTGVANAPLWNHEVTAATFTPYASTSLTATVGQPAGASKLCLSCHDGTVAVDNYGGRTNGTDFISGGKNLGTSLSNDHPISFTYDATLASNDGGLFDPSTATTSLGGTIDHDLLSGGSMECSSCHDVHNANNNADLLVVSNAASALCLTCHSK